MNLKDFMTSPDSQMIMVPGIGQMRLTQAKARVKEMLDDLTKRVDTLTSDTGDQSGWTVVDDLMKRGVLQAYLDAIVQATKRQH